MTQQEINQAIESSRNAKQAGSTGFCIYTEEHLTRYCFGADHYTWSRPEERKLAEDLISSNFPSSLVYDYAAEYCKAHQIQWGSMQMLGEPRKYSSRDDEYHVCFDVLISQPVEE